MEPDERLNDIKYAMNTRLFLLMAGVVLVFNAITSTVPQSSNWLSIAKIVSEYDGEVPPEETAPVSSAAEEAEAVSSVAEEPAAAESGTVSVESPADAGSGEDAASQEMDVPALIRSMNSIGITVGDLKVVGYAGLVMALIRSIIGILCVLLCNRVNKAHITFAAAIILVVCEVLYTALLFFKAALSIGSLLYTVIITGILLFGAIRMRKIAKNDPGRILAVETARPVRSPRQEAPKKSLHDRATMKTDDEE